MGSYQVWLLAAADYLNLGNIGTQPYCFRVSPRSNVHLWKIKSASSGMDYPRPAMTFAIAPSSRLVIALERCVCGCMQAAIGQGIASRSSSGMASHVASDPRRGACASKTSRCATEKEFQRPRNPLNTNTRLFGLFRTAFIIRRWSVCTFGFGICAATACLNSAHRLLFPVVGMRNISRIEMFAAEMALFSMVAIAKIPASLL